MGFSLDGITLVTAHGEDFSSGGARILTQFRTPDGEFKLRVMLEERDFTITVVRVRESKVKRLGQVWYATGLRTVAIAEGDSAFVDEFVLGLQYETKNEALSELERLLKDFPADGPEVADKKTSPRKAKPFYIAFSVHDLPYMPAYGLDLGHDGLRIFSDGQMPDEPFKVRIILQGRDFIVTVKKNWDKQILRADKVGWITGTRFTSIGPIDHEFCDCYVSGEVFCPDNKLLEALARLRLEPDQANTFLPPDLLDKLLHRLVELNRLAPLVVNVYPLVRYRFEGTKTIGDAKVNVLFIESRVGQKDGGQRFTSRFGFDDTGSNIHLLK